MSFYTHTLVRNGQPFIGLILRQVIPFAEKCLITVHWRSNDGTIAVLNRLQEEFPDKIVLNFESSTNPAELTKERQKQLDATPEGKWILFTDDDDYWPEESLQEFEKLIASDSVHAYAFNPYQIIDRQHFDDSWRNKWFTKLFRKQADTHYEKPWPRDLIFNGKEELYWRKNPKVVKVTPKYFHLSNIKHYSFRNQPGFEKYKNSIGKPAMLPIEAEKEMEKIYGI